MAVLAATLAACAPRSEADPEAAIETVEVGAGPTAAMTAEGDQAAAASSDEGLIGVLPGDFPPDLPLVEPASVIDFGTATDRFVVLRTGLARSAAEAQLARRLDAAGWASAGDRWTRSRGRDTVRIAFESGRAGQTLVRIRY
ncbi:MAG TPA: hypothetical protein VMV46_15330 [Thermoanaerobaculia bacterium]|nr:hypothetical protein [Thermoanaerobaculia bacterium]